jgi:hypothetical protein
MNKSDSIRKLLAKGIAVKEIAKRLRVATNNVYQVRWQDRQDSKAKKKKVKAKAKKKPSKIIKATRITKAELNALLPKPKKPRKVRITRKKLLKELQPGLDALFGLEYKKQEAPTPDLVNNPPHYKSGGIETIDFIEAKDLNYRLGNVVKYVSRAGRKAGSDPVVDLEKAAFYLQREINARKGA